MKNLNVWDVNVKSLNLRKDDEYCICYSHDDSNAGELYTCSYNLLLKNFNENGDERWSKDLSEEVGSPDNIPVNVTYLSLLNTLCVGLSNGELFTFGDYGNTCDLAGVCENGLLAMEWSPDQELLVLVTREFNMILMSCTYDPIYEVNLHKEEFGEKQFVTVGWGKKETQFHGSEGKNARVQKEVSVDHNIAIDDKVKITWRGDGHLFAVGFAHNGMRRFKVFDREGHLQYTSEKQQGLEANLCWRPSGNVIATTQRLQDKYLIAFFEKNGLKHGGFDIPVSSNTVVEDIQWSADSEILMLQCKETSENGTTSQTLLLFTMANYHWYLKQSLVFNNDQTICKILWDNDFDVQNNKKLHVILCGGDYYSYSWIWNIDHSKGKTEEDDAIVTVIDGKKVLVTGFRQTVVPPPMAALEIELDAFVNSVHFISQSSSGQFDSNSFAVVTADEKVTFFKQKTKFPLDFTTVTSKEISDKSQFPFQNYNWHWKNSDSLLCCKVNKTNEHSLIEFGLTYSKDEEIILNKVVELPESPLRINSVIECGSDPFIQLSNGSIIKVEDKEIVRTNISFKSICPKFNVFSVDGENHFIGLSHKGNLFIDSEMVINNVSSFFVHTDFLLITTLQHLLLCVELTNAGINAIIEHSKIVSSHIYQRKIERGAKLVVTVPQNTRTVFQMPRGNLETIQPRPLTLKIVGKYLDSLKYHEAFDLMRKERINLNLIYDHSSELFMSHINEFLETIKNNSWLSLFLSDLENVDVTKTMYSSSYAQRNDAAVVNNNVNNKINIVCEAVRAHLKSRSDIDSKILPLLTSFVKTNDINDLEEALKLIKGLKEREGTEKKLPVGTDEALKYLLYMVEVNKLFDVALGLYDFDLVLLVANKSQKDPKEFIPMLNELNEMEENYKRFSINKHLKRFDEAVQSLVKCGAEKHAELRTFVKYHSLYSEALALFSPEEEIYQHISEDFGLYLRLKKQFTEAGIIYERASNYDKAIECYKDALEWELAINLAQSWPNEQIQELCWDLISALKDEKRHKEALTILEQYYNDKKEAIMYAIENGQYKTALRLCRNCNRNDLKEQNLQTAVLEDYNNLKEQIETNWSNYIRHRDRLRIVRETKKNNPVEMYDPAFDNRDCDLYSDAGSTLASSSRGSSRSFRSSKNRRKHERKIASLKEGSQYEDVALVMALYTLVTSSFELRLQVKDVNTALACFGKDKEALVLQTSLDRLLKEMKDSLREVWSHELMMEAAAASIAAENAPEGSSVLPQGIASLEPQMRIAPVITEVTWKLEGLY